MRLGLTPFGVTLAWCVGCGTTGGAPDAGPDAGASFGTCTNAPDSDWTGWSRVPSAPSCCVIDQIDDPSTLPKLSWTPCIDGRPNCEQLGAFHNFIGVPAVEVSFHEDGSPALLVVQEGGSPTDSMEHRVYDLNTLAPLAAWRVGVDTRVGGGQGCYLVVTPSATMLAVDIYEATKQSFDIGRDLLTVGTPAQLRADLPGAEISTEIIPRGDWLTGLWLTDSMVALNTHQHRSARRQLSATEYIPFVGKPVAVYGDDVFALEVSEAGPSTVDRVDVNGQRNAFVEPSGVAMKDFIANDSSIAWAVDADGGASIDVMSAPYTTDPSVLAANAKKLETFSSQQFPAFRGTLSGGIYATTSMSVTFARLRDGAAQTLPAMPNDWFFMAYANAPSTRRGVEAWIVQGGQSCYDAGCDSNMWITRFPLPAWP